MQGTSTTLGCDIADPGVLDDVLVAMEASSFSSPCCEPSAMKASQGVVDVVTDIGTQVRRVPATLKQLLAAPDCEEWLTDQLSTGFLTSNLQSSGFLISNLQWAVDR